MFIAICYILFFAALTSYISIIKNYNPYKWFVIGAMTGAIGLLVILFEPKK